MWLLLLEITQVERDRIALVFIAPPCGAASLARERKLLKWARKGFKIPVPLRNAQFPDMLPGLSFLDKKKVELANQLYAQVTRVSIVCISLGILVTIENPATSPNWMMTFFLELKAFCNGRNVDFHSCCHGGQRPKHTRSLCSVSYPCFATAVIGASHGLQSVLAIDFTSPRHGRRSCLSAPVVPKTHGCLA